MQVIQFDGEHHENQPESTVPQIDGETTPENCNSYPKVYSKSKAHSVSIWSPPRGILPALAVSTTSFAVVRHYFKGWGSKLWKVPQARNNQKYETVPTRYEKTWKKQGSNLLN